MRCNLDVYIIYVFAACDSHFRYGNWSFAQMFGSSPQEKSNQNKKAVTEKTDHKSFTVLQQFFYWLTYSFKISICVHKQFIMKEQNIKITSA